MKMIFERLKENAFPNCSTLGRELEVSARTVRRDIDVMRDQMSLPIHYCANRHGYYFTEKVHGFPTIQVTQGELLALLVAQKAIEQYQGTPYHAQLETAFAKVLAPLQSMGGVVPADDIISFKIAAPATHELETFDSLGAAIARCREVDFDYRKPGASQPAAPRTVRPLHLTHRDGRWYLVGYDVVREGMRTYALGRIGDVQIRNRSFERPEDFSVDRYFASALGVMNGTEAHHVRIRFSQFAADHVRDRFWHESQQIEELPDGGMVLGLQLADLLEVQRLVLQWGGHAEALEPPQLRERIAEAAASLRRSHRGSQTSAMKSDSG